MSDYLTDEEQVARLKSWWDENGKSLLAALVLVIGGVGGYRWYESYTHQSNMVASDLYEVFTSSVGDARDEALATLAEQAAGTSYHALALLQVAKSSAEAGDYEAAQRQLDEAAQAAPEALLADVARLRRARVLQQLDRMDEALGVRGGIRSPGFRGGVAELRGDIHLLRGERALAHEAYLAALEAGDVNRPVLSIKVADTADAGAPGAAADQAPAAEEAPAADVEPAPAAGPAAADEQAAPDTPAQTGQSGESETDA